MRKERYNIVYLNLVLLSFESEIKLKCNIYISSARIDDYRNSLVILDSCSRKTRSGKSHDYRDVVVFREKLRFQNVLRLRPHGYETPALLNSSRLKTLLQKISLRQRPRRSLKTQRYFYGLWGLPSILVFLAEYILQYVKQNVTVSSTFN